MSDVSRKLTDQAVAGLIEALRKLRYVHHVKYRELARAISVADNYIWNVNAGRVRPSAEFEAAVYKFAEDNKYDLGGKAISLADYQLSVAMEMDLDEDTLRADIERLRGDYLCYTRTRNGFSVSCLTFYNSDQAKWWPEFSAWHPSLMIQGYYFTSKGMIHLIGHIYDTALPRLMTFWRDASVHSTDYVGTISLSNPTELSLFSWAYLERTDVNDLRSRKWKDLGHFDLAQLPARNSSVDSFFAGKQVLGVARPSE